MKTLCMIAALVLLSGCASKSMLSRASAGEIGCQTDDITIADVSNDFMTGLTTWTATCKGQTFICSGPPVDPNCEKRLEAAE